MFKLSCKKMEVDVLRVDTFDIHCRFVTMKALFFLNALERLEKHNRYRN